MRRTKQKRVLRTLCDGAKLRRLATTPGGAGLIPAGVRFGARPFPPAAPAEQSNRPTRASTPGLPTWWFDFLQAEGRGRPSHKVRKTQICFECDPTIPSLPPMPAAELIVQLILSAQPTSSAPVPRLLHIRLRRDAADCSRDHPVALDGFMADPRKRSHLARCGSSLCSGAMPANSAERCRCLYCRIARSAHATVGPRREADDKTSGPGKIGHLRVVNALISWSRTRESRNHFGFCSCHHGHSERIANLCGIG